MTRDPRTPDCAIRGCTRAEFRQDLCRAHYGLLPLQDNLARAAETMMRSHREAQERRNAVVAKVQAIVDGGATR